jgi:hypothetical protein
MPDKVVDHIFKDKMAGLDRINAMQGWNKESSWQRLIMKRRQRNFRRFYFYAAAFLVSGFLIAQVIRPLSLDKGKNVSEELSILEYQKRQKLAEIEARMSGNYYSIKICSICDNIHYQLIKEDRPVQYRYFQIN